MKLIIATLILHNWYQNGLRSVYRNATLIHQYSADTKSSKILGRKQRKLPLFTALFSFFFIFITCVKITCNQSVHKDII